MTQCKFPEIDNLNEALATMDNRHKEWYESLLPLGKFVVFFFNALRIGYEFPLTPDTRRHAGALYSIAEENDIREQLAIERSHLQNQRQVMLQLEKDFAANVKKNEERIHQWKALLDDDENPPSPDFQDYYSQMIEYTSHSSKRLLQAMKKVTTTAIESDESLVFNDLQQHSSLVCYMQDRHLLREQLENAKKQRLEIERIRKDVHKNMEFLGDPDPLQRVHLASFPLHQTQTDEQ